MSHMPPAADDLLTRDATAEALTEAGYPIRTATLATMATRSGGPPYAVFNGKALYRWRTSLAWAESRLTRPRSRAFMPAATDPRAA